MAFPTKFHITNCCDLPDPPIQNSLSSYMYTMYMTAKGKD